MRSRTISADEPVVFAGDLNTERFDPSAERRFGEILHASYGAFAGCSQAPLYPTTPAGDSLDLSDHYAVVGSLVFPGAPTAAAVTTVNRR